MTSCAEKRKVLVTGGTSGLGRVIAAGFAAAGDDIIICSRTKQIAIVSLPKSQVPVQGSVPVSRATS